MIRSFYLWPIKQNNASVDILLARRKHLHDRIISLEGEITPMDLV